MLKFDFQFYVNILPIFDLKIAVPSKVNLNSRKVVCSRFSTAWGGNHCSCSLKITMSQISCQSLINFNLT